MTVDFATLEGVPQGEAQLALHVDVAEHLGEPQRVVAGWVINRIRDDGAVDAYVPIPVINVEGVAIDESNVDGLVRKFDARAREVGGSGQRDPCVLGHVPKEDIYMLDGYHRRTVQVARGISHLHCTVEPNLTFDKVVERRIEYAQKHTGIVFAREHEWMEEDWEQTDFYDDLPEGMTALAAIRLVDEGVALQENTGFKVIHRLPAELSDKVCAWVVDRCDRWDYTPTQIREKLAQGEGFARELMPLVWQKQGRTPAGRISVAHVEAINAVYAGETDMQGPIVDLVVAHELSVPQTQRLIDLIEAEEPYGGDDIPRAVADIDFLALKRRPSTKSKGGYSKSPARFTETREVTPAGLIKSMRARLPDIQDDALSGRWGPEELDDLLEVTASLSELLAQVALSTTTNSGEQTDGAS